MRKVILLSLATLTIFFLWGAPRGSVFAATSSPFTSFRLSSSSSFKEGVEAPTFSLAHPYEEVLETWRRKQAEKWRNLPTEPFSINASAYTAAADECGKSDGITASGIPVQEGRTLACPSRFPFGTTIFIEGMGLYVCEDRGGAIKGNRFDIYMKTKREAFAFGRRSLIAWVVPSYKKEHK